MVKYKFSELPRQNGIEYAPDCDIKVNRHYCSTAETLHNHDYYELAYIQEGNGIQIVNGVSYAVETGSMIILSPKDTHSYYSIKEMKLYNVCFCSPDKLMHYFDFSKPTVVALDDFFKIEIEQFIYLLESELNQKRNTYLETAWVILDLIIMTASRNHRNEIYSDPMWGKIFTYISKNIGNVSLKDVAQAMSVSESYFCRVFKKNFSMTFHQYVVNVRMQMAKNYLLNSKKSITEIAAEVGYKSECCFFQDFKKSVGTTPKEFRKKSAGNNKGSAAAITDNNKFIIL